MKQKSMMRSETCALAVDVASDLSPCIGVAMVREFGR